MPKVGQVQSERCAAGWNASLRHQRALAFSAIAKSVFVGGIRKIGEIENDVHMPSRAIQLHESHLAHSMRIRDLAFAKFSSAADQIRAPIP
ncbi:hypothetical protein [Lysobacter sp. TAB13]|uniref:hypothetical protein n=1 Tax=Lysobacter sp. TAB13 TaxID=3233065 RepID=UPI003F96AEAC